MGVVATITRGSGRGETVFRSGLIPPAELESALSDLTAALNEQSKKQTGEAFERLWDLVSACERAAPRLGVLAGAPVPAL